MSETFSKNDGVDLKDLFTSQIENIKTLIDANDKAYNQRFENVIQATTAALNAADRAVNKAEGASEKRFDAVNEFRSTLSDQQRTLMPRAEAEILIKGLNEKLESLTQTSDSQKNQSIGQREGMTEVALVASVVSTIVVILSRLIR